MKRIYFDLSATTPVDPRVVDYIHKIQEEVYGNPSSIHREGQAARAVVEKSRSQLANVLKCKSQEILFTASGSEANNMVLQGVLKNGDHFITSSYEHPSILKVIPWLEKQGVETTLVKPDEYGIVQPYFIEDKIKGNTRLISIMFVNNELGTINPIEKIGQMCNEKNILFHSDAVQALGKLSFDVNKFQADFLSMSAHKLYGPKGAGALFKQKNSPIDPLIYGGGQEGNLRSGTENIAGIAGFGLAAEIAYINLENNLEKIQELEKHFLSQLNYHNINYKINGKQRLTGVLNITFPNIDGQTLVMQLDLEGIGISYGAACASGISKTTSFLVDMGLTQSEAQATVRISMGKIHNQKDVTTVVHAINNILIKYNNIEAVHEG